MSMPLGPESCTTVCPHCNNRMETRTEHKASNKTHILALILCLFVCWPCACCLYCTGCARNVEHYCSKCNNFVGVYER